MSLDKLVDSTQLDSDLTSVANAIRTKGGTNASLAFPAGFVSAVQAIPTGGTPTGTKQISITQNGTTTEDVTNYANAEITVNVSGGGEAGINDFSGGNILAIIGNGAEYIETDYLPPFSGVFCAKLSDSARTRYQHYWGATQASNRIGMQVNNGIMLFVPGYSTGYVATLTGWSSGNVVTPILSGSNSIVAAKPLVFFRGYYNGSLESSIAKFTFYGLNIMSTDFEPVKKYRPWLDNGIACIKEMISGTIYHNSGSGAFKYVDLNGVVHSA